MTTQEFIRDFEKLKKKFPKPPTTNLNSDNCDWCDQIFNSHDSYYTFDGAQMANCLYCYDAFTENNDVDCTFCARTEFNCEVSDSIDSNGCYFGFFLARCYNLWFCDNCFDSHDCFGCTHLQNKSYCIFNIQYTKEEYNNELPKLKKLSRKEVLSKVNNIRNKLPRLHSDYSNAENCDYCDYAYNDKNLYYGFDSTMNEDCGYLTVSHRNKNVWDGTYAFRSELSAEVRDSSEGYNCYDISDCGRVYDSCFLYRCLDCNNCFGCVELVHKSYCILNVQYTKDEYFSKLAELKNELNIHFTI